MSEEKYKLNTPLEGGSEYATKDGHTMFLCDIVKELNWKCLIETELEELKEEKDLLNRKIATLEEDLNDLQDENDSLESHVASLEYDQRYHGDSIEGFLIDVRSWLERSISDRETITPLSIDGGESVYKRLNNVLWNEYSA